MKLILLLLLAGCMTYYKGPKSDHFDGERFFNKYPPSTDKSFSKLLKWRIFGEHSKWPQWIDSEYKKLSTQRSQTLKVTFINHASALIQVDNINIITDPHFSDRASPVSFAGPKRVRKPGIKFEDLPPLDFVLVSHNHYDHLDITTLQKIYKEHPNVKILVGLGNNVLLKDEGIQGLEMDWGDSQKKGSVKITFREAHHWSARGMFDKRKTLWGSFIIESSQGNIYFAGDTGYSPHFKDIGRDFGPFKVSLIPIGAYEPRWFMKSAHVNPQEAVQAHLDLKSEKSIGIHFGTFQLTDEPISEPLEKLEKAKRKQGLSVDEFVAPEFGETFSF